MHYDNRGSMALGASQRGAVLIIGLIMLLLMTIVGLAAIRGSGLQEMMAGNMRERTLAFQAAEAGLREGETELINLAPEDFDDQVNGLYPDLGVVSTNPFQQSLSEWSAEQWGARGLQTSLSLEGPVSGPPIYVVEHMTALAQQVAENTGSGIDIGSLESTGLELDFYRVSARGESASGTATAIVQSTYRVK
ncbi:pilus assembly PilX family protein [Marinimicrobium sp. ARAG 43.8]|uniref:pilus assembly PilX family protein n=1 Tax=Marinimicrobium sp. ARAG 43.8 TaxID=3418719 RepID=UPI003CF52DFD